ncbi:MAG: DUF5722 domain-containing protein [Candidatus Cryptobacteroides sp.]
MKFLSRFAVALMLSTAVLASCETDDPADNQGTSTQKPEQKPDPEPEEKPELKSVSLSIVQDGCHSVSIENMGNNTYTIRCTGGDPYLFTSKFTSDVPIDHAILEFEYTSDANLTADLQIFYVNGAPAENSSKKYGTLPATSTYKTFTAEITSFREAGWGKSGHRLRIDPGDNSGPTVTIRNLKIRQMNDEEKNAYGDALVKEQAKQDMADRIDKYLATDYPSSVSNVTVTKSSVIIEGTCGGDGTYALAEVTPWQDITELDSFPYVENISGKNFKVTLDRIASAREGIDYDRVFSKWAVVKVDGDKHILDSHGRYADDVEPVTSPEALPLKNKKGIAAGDHTYYFNDLAEMNCGSNTMNVVLDNIMPGKGSDYTFGGISYKVGDGKSYVDRIVSSVKDMRLIVSAIILCPTGGVFTDPECAGGYYSMPNITTAEAFNHYAAALSYMASRYNDIDIHGRICNWIMHNEVDAGTTWTNMGDQPMTRYLDRYVKSMRICYNIVRQYDQNAAILASYTHSWTGKEDYSPKEMLEKTVEFSNAEGDFWWGVAYHPYPQSLTVPSLWSNDKQATYSMDTKFITFKNLEVLDKWMKLPENLYKGEKKRICFLSENGTNSPSYSDTDLALQAAGGCWAWKKVKNLDGIDAIQWHNWADNKAEFGLRIGLRSFEDSGFQNLDRKPVWYVWKAAGTNDEEEVFAPYLSTIGISDWDSIMHEVE